MPHSRTPATYRFLLLAFALTASFGWTALSFADEFLLDDGRRIEGTIVREIGSLVSIKTTDGKVITIRKDQIESRKVTKTAYDEYLERSKDVDAKSASAQFALAQWCESKKLDAQKTLHLKKVIELDPSHKGARLALGYELIAGDWYLKGSPQAAARKAELAKPIAGKVKEIPDDAAARPRPTAPKPAPMKPKVNSVAVQCRFDEKLGGEAPSVSLAYYRIRDLFRDLDEPLHLVDAPKDGTIADGYLLDVKIRTFFVRVNKFYNKPISNVYRGEAEVTLYKVEGGKKSSVMKIGKLQVPFGASLELSKKDAYGYAYYDTVHQMIAKLSRTPFLRKRGAKPYDAPGE